MIVSDGNPGDGSQYNERFLSAEEEVETLEEKKGMVYPNPADGTIHVRHKQNLTFQYQVYNMDGKVIETGVSAENNTTFHLPSGIYIVKIQTHENTEIHKVIVR